MSILKSKNLITKSLSQNSEVIKVEGDLLHSLQQLELEMLKDIVNTCKENSINVLLGGGTLLGAVRHKGFIPWDDDIDLNIQRKYVQDFINIITKKYSNKYSLNYKNKMQDCAFIQIGYKGTIMREFVTANKKKEISIDVFVIEDLPKNAIIRYIYGIICTIRLYIAGCVAFYENNNEDFINIMRANIKTKVNLYIKKIIGFIFSYKSYNDWLIDNDKYFSKYYGNESNSVVIPTGRKHFFGEIYSRDMFEEFITVSFEGTECRIQKKYDSYLKQLYGKNYMKIPKESDREHHYVFDIKI